MRHQAIRLATAIIVTLGLFIPASAAWMPRAQAQAPDPYEPDDPGLGDPPWIANDEAQVRSFYPEGDVDRARFRVKAGHWYEVHTRDLAPLVDTVLTVELDGTVLNDDDGGPEPLASRLTFQAANTGEALITVLNSQAVYSTTQTYALYAGETAAPTPAATDTPTPTPTSTPTSTPTPTPKPTRTPPPTTTPPAPIISFSALPERTQGPGECVTLRWHVERASEVYLLHPNGNQEGVVGQEERQVCPLETGTFRLKVYAPGGDETVEVVVTVPQPTPTPTPASRPSGSGATRIQKGTLHVAVFVDENRSAAYDPGEGVLGLEVLLMSQADPGQLWRAGTDAVGQAHLQQVPSGSYTLLIPHLGHAETLAFRGEEVTVDLTIAPMSLPVRIP